jgi:hypothetical protein
MREEYLKRAKDLDEATSRLNIATADLLDSITVNIKSYKLDGK